jgi:hypothetical protein
MTERPTKITFGEMRDMGVRRLLIYCADYRCSHSTVLLSPPEARGSVMPGPTA